MSDDSSRRRALLEVYKLHSELAERVASLREGVNKLHAGIVASIVAVSVLLHRVGYGSAVVWILPLLAIVTFVSWFASMSSVTGRLTAKSKVLKELELELKLGFNFLAREEEEFQKGRALRRKFSGLLIPVLFAALCLVWIVVLHIRS